MLYREFNNYEIKYGSVDGTTVIECLLDSSRVALIFFLDNDRGFPSSFLDDPNWYREEPPPIYTEKDYVNGMWKIYYHADSFNHIFEIIRSKNPLYVYLDINNRETGITTCKSNFDD